MAAFDNLEEAEKYARQQYSDNVSVLLGNGEGNFEQALSFGAGSNPRWLAVGDFNGDRVPDLAVANYRSNNVSVLINNTCR